MAEETKTDKRCANSPLGCLKGLLPVVLLLWPLVVQGDDDVFTIAFGSCNIHTFEQPLWKPILSHHPDVWIWTGDIIYADSGSEAEVRARFPRYYEIQKNQPDYKVLRDTSQVIGVWDDHDYGVNNGGRGYRFKALTQEYLLDFLDEPAGSPRRKQAGVYAKYDYYFRGKNIRVVLLDTRTHKSKPGPRGDILGEQQWEFLAGALRESPADLTVIVSSFQIVSVEQDLEKWADYPASHEKLLTLVAAAQPKGVLLITGDRHHGEISVKRDWDARFPLVEITSSGLTHYSHRTGEEPNRYRTGPLWRHLNFGLLRFEVHGARLYLQAELRGLKDRTVNQVNLIY